MTEQLLPKAKKSVALSGTAAGNTAICTVGRTGNDLRYRGYDIKVLAEACELEEVDIFCVEVLVFLLFLLCAAAAARLEEETIVRSCTVGWSCERRASR